MPFFNSGNTAIYYEEMGEGTPIVFLHGFSLDRRMWQEQTDYFSARYRVISYDARGHGKSDSPKTGYSREDRVGDLLNLVRHLNFPKFHLVGLSMGGGDAFSFAIDHQDKLLSLTLVGTVVSGWQPSKRFHDFSAIARERGLGEAKKKFMESVLTRYDKRDPILKERLRTIMSDFGGEPWRDPMKGKYPKRDDLRLCAKIGIPILIVVGQHDIFFRPLAEQLHDRMLNSQLEIIPEAGHMVNLEAPKRFNMRLEGFFQEVSEGNSLSGRRNAG